MGLYMEEEGLPFRIFFAYIGTAGLMEVGCGKEFVSARSGGAHLLSQHSGGTCRMASSRPAWAT
jgi:hypothetical protein